MDVTPLSNTLSLFNAPATPTSTTGSETASPPPLDTVSLGNDVEAQLYRSYAERIQLSLRAQQQTLTTTDDATGEQVQLSAQQLEFSFFSETRVTEVARFRERTGAVAEGLEGPRQGSYLEASQRLAARFELSVSISGQALDGFAGASESLQENGFDLDRFLELTQGILDETDSIVDELFSLLQGYFAGETDETGFVERIQSLFDQLNQVVGKAFEGFGGQALGQSSAVQLEFSFSFSAEYSAVVQQGDPVVLDLDGDGIELTDYRAGARFDLQATGRLARTAFVTGGDAFLALDRNNNGTIDDGRELFGDQAGDRNGFEALRRLDSNGDGVIDARDRDFGRLLLLRDNGDGVVRPDELLSLRDADIARIELDYRDVDEEAAGGNRLAQISAFQRGDGSRGQVGDALLNFIA
jgi:hypothetical protein